MSLTFKIKASYKRLSEDDHPLMLDNLIIEKKTQQRVISSTTKEHKRLNLLIWLS